MNASPPPRSSELAALGVCQALIGSSKTPPRQILCTSIGRGQIARGLWRQNPTAAVTLVYLDQFQQQQTIADHESEMQTVGSDDRLSIICAADLPDAAPGGDAFDLAVIPCSVRGEAELQRDLLQQAHQRLAIGGWLVSSVDHVKDKWLHEQMKSLGAKVSVVHTETSAVYTVCKTEPLKRIRSFDCEFSFRDAGQTVLAFSRPSVFSHRHLDGGAAALIQAATVAPGEWVIDVGCGAGVVAIAIAKREPSAHVYAVDGNVRAIESTRRGAELNGLTNVTTRLTCEGHCDRPATYDLALCNPPYYSNFRIAALFVDTARRALKPGGRILVVTKHAAWYQENMYPGWRDIVVDQGRQYAIVRAIRG